jgi:D-3-phosphoglycerate dehydrogenase
VRNLSPALQFVDGLHGDDKSLHEQIEDGKKQFAGCELPHHTLGIIGLGKIGSLVADTAIKLGMQVLGYDPEITVDAAWSLPSQVKKAHSVEEVLKHSHFVTLHMPLVDEDAQPDRRQAIELMRRARCCSISRATGSSTTRGRRGAGAHKLKNYVCDFRATRCAAMPGVDRACRTWARRRAKPRTTRR